MMPLRGKLITFAIVIFLLSGCHFLTKQPKVEMATPDSQKNNLGTTEQVHDEQFHPYEYTGVPTLERLIFSSGFMEYVMEKPYILGYSHEGNYVAMVVYDTSKEGFLVEVIDTLTNNTAYEAYVPNIERLLSGDQVTIDLLTTAQESLDMGYRIKVAPSVTVLNDRHYRESRGENGNYHFYIDYEIGGTFQVTVEDKSERQWVVVSDTAPVQAGHQFIEEFTIATHPQMPERVNVMVYTKQRDNVVVPYVYTINTDILDKALSEQALKNKLSQWLDEPQIVYRYPATVNTMSVLAVGGMEDEQHHTSLLFKGRVKQFAFIDEKGNIPVYADEDGVFIAEDELLMEMPPVHYYEVALIPGLIGNEAELLVVDVFDEDDEMRQTLEWRWDTEKRMFQLIE